VRVWRSVRPGTPIYVVKGSVVEAVAQRAQGERVSRPRALLVATVVGVGAAVATYKLLRSGGEQ
jgi:hypothetical protein